MRNWIVVVLLIGCMWGVTTAVIVDDGSNRYASELTAQRTAARLGSFGVVGSGVAACSGAGSTTSITFHASTACKYVQFWLSPGASSVQVSSLGATASATSPSYDSSMSPVVIELPTASNQIGYVPAGTSGTFYWIAGN